MKRIGFSGTFDPLTNGHLWVIEEALNLAEEVCVFVAINSAKKPMITINDRVALIKGSTSHLGDRVKVFAIEGEYVAQIAKEKYQCDYMMRGIRNAGDFDYESLIQQTNRDILGGAKTIFVFPPRDLESVSSSFVKSLVGPLGWHYYIEDFLPSFVLDYWITSEIKKIIREESFDILDKIKNPSLMMNFQVFIENILEMYSKNYEKYHNKSHILYMLQVLRKAKSNLLDNDICILSLIVAILGHDCIMNGKNGKTPEQLSAIFIKSKLSEVDPLNLIFKIEEINSAILATGYVSSEDSANHLNSPLSKALTYIDLSILGSNLPIYEKYSKKVRQEYSNIPIKDYYEGRINVLEKLILKIENEQFFKSDFIEGLKDKSIFNMTQEITALKKSLS